MVQYVKLYYFFEKPVLKTIRWLLFLGVTAWIGYAIFHGVSLKWPLILFSFFSMSEIFINFKLAKLYPKHTLSENPSDTREAATMPVLAMLQITDPKAMLDFLKHQPEARFMLSRMMILPNQLQPVTIDQHDLLAKATQYAKTTHTSYIDVPHLFAAYLMSTEETTKLLFQSKLKETDVLRLIIWTTLCYPKRQQAKRVRLIGEGYGEALTRGWTYETSKYTLDWTTEALLNEPMIFGQTEVFQQIISILSQPKHNNVLIIGAAGSGKHILIDKLAFESYNGHVPHNLQHKRVLALVTGALLAGMQEPSELETRLQLLLAELSHADVVMAIPEIQDILGSHTFNIDLSGVLLPYLEHGATPIIATTTAENYKKYVEHSALKDVFTPITLKTPDTETLFGMLFMAVMDLERKQRLHFSYLSIVKAQELASRFDTTGALPGSAVKLLEATGTALLVSGKNIVSEDDVASYVESTTHVRVTEPGKEEKAVLLDLEGILHQRIIGQHTAISAISQGMRRLREGLGSTTKPVSFLFLGPTGVGKTETAKALADVYYHGQTNILRFDMSEYSGADGIKRLLGAVAGEGDEKGELTEKVFDHPSSLILLDEFEKANPAILDLFLQVLDDGRLTDNKGKTVSFTNCIIIATSNAGSEFIREHIDQSNNSHPEQSEGSQTNFHQQLLNFLQTNHLFKPELLNRFDEVVVFTPLSSDEVLQVTIIQLQILTKKMLDQDITISFDIDVIRKIASESYNASMGARPIQRYIQEHLEDLIAKAKLEGKLQRGMRANFGIDQPGNIILQVLA